MWRMTEDVVKKFSHVERYEAYLKKERRDRHLVQVTIQSELLQAAAIIGLYEKSGRTALVGQVASGFVSTRDVKNVVRGENPGADEELRKSMRSVSNYFIHDDLNFIDKAFLELVHRRKNTFGEDIADVMGIYAFQEPDPDFMKHFRRQIGHYMLAVIVNLAWRFDRPYIVWVDAPDQGCEFDSRGLITHRICSPKYSRRSFWIHAIQSDNENSGKNWFAKEGPVSSPTGYSEFLWQRALSHNITTEDMLLSPLFVHTQKLQWDISQNHFKETVSALKATNDIGWGKVFSPLQDQVSRNLTIHQVPGVFSIPICKNPEGEVS